MHSYLVRIPAPRSQLHIDYLNSKMADDESRDASKDPNFTVELDEDGPEFYSPGQTVTGYVLRVVTADEEKINAHQEMKCTGEASAHWCTVEGELPVEHANVEVYFEHVYSFDLAKDGSETLTLAEGTHKWPFSYILPTHIPSSFKCPAAKIEYIFEATLTRPGKGLAVLSASIKIPVWRQPDLNDHPDFAQGRILENSKYLCCWCCKRGPIGFKLSFDTTGFLFEGPIECGMELVNQSSRNVRVIEATVFQSVQIASVEGLLTTGHNEKVLGACQLPGIAPWQQSTTRARMDIFPTDPYPLNLYGCGFMKVVHDLEVKMVIPGARNLSASLPIAVGMLPFRAHERRQSRVAGGDTSAAVAHAHSRSVGRASVGGASVGKGRSKSVVGSTSANEKP